MIDLTGKSVFVKTQEEYSKILRIARLQGFKWAGRNHLNVIDIPLPNMLNFYDERIATYNSDDRKLYDVHEIVAYEEEIKDAVSLVRTFTRYPDRTVLADSFVESLKILVDTVESQMEEVK